jgi:hypothetical protein
MDSACIMNTNFESDFLKSMTKYKIKDKYYDEYLKTTRYHLLSYNNLCDQYKNYTNNNIINDNKHTFIHVNESKKDFILNKIKSIIIKQKKLYNNLIHHYKTTNPEFLIDNSEITSKDIQDTASIHSVKTIKSIDSSHSSKSTQSKHSIRSKHSIQSKQSTKSTKIYRIERKKEHDTLSLNEHPKKQKFAFFTRKNKDN